jgi:hypothetical protein
MSTKIPDKNFKSSRGLKLTFGLIAVSGLTYALNKYLIDTNPQLIRKVYFDKLFNYNQENVIQGIEEIDGKSSKSSSQYVKFNFLFTHRLTESNLYTESS